MPREELKSRLKNLPAFSAKLFNALLSKLAGQKEIEESGPSVRMPSFTIQFNPIQEQKNKSLLKRFTSSPFAPPSVKESQAEIGEESFQALVETGQLILVAPEVVFRVQDYQQMVAEIRQLISQHGQISAAMVRDHFNTSRKYALAILEHLDRNGVTVREGDFRRLQ
jgi:selenocysteine-specific elongation factor